MNRLPAVALPAGPAPAATAGRGADVPGIPPGGGAPVRSAGGEQASTGGRSRRRRVVVLGGAVAILVAAAVAVPLVVLGGGGGSGEPSTAERAAVSTHLAAEAASRRSQDPRVAAKLSLTAYAVAPTAAARDALIAAFTRSTAVPVGGAGTAFTDLALSADGTVLACTDAAGRLHLWRIDAQGRPVIATGGSDNDHASGTVFDSSGRVLATGGATDAGRLWDVSDPARPHALGSLGMQPTTVHQLALSSQAHLLATAGVDWSVGLWDIRDPAHPVSRQLLIGRSGPVTSMALRPDGGLLAIAGVGGVQLWDVRDPGHPQQTGSVPGRTGAVNTVAFGSDGTRLATGSDDRILQISDVSDPANPRVVRQLSGHAAPVTAVAFAGRDQLISADTGGTLAYWNLGAATPAFTSLGALDGPPRTMSTTGAGSVALTTGRGTILLGTLDPARLRRLACATPGAAPSRAEWNGFAPGIPYTDACAD